MNTRGVLEPMLLTPEEAAEVLRVSRSTIYDLMRSERLQSVKIGGSRRVPVAAVTLFVEALCGEDVA